MRKTRYRSEWITLSLTLHEGFDERLVLVVLAHLGVGTMICLVVHSRWSAQGGKIELSAVAWGCVWTERFRPQK